jgi:hypothetical protein
MTRHLCCGLQARGLRSEHGARGQSRVQEKSQSDGDVETGGAENEPVDRLGCKASFLDHPLEILILHVFCAPDAKGSVTKAVMRFDQVERKIGGVIELHSSVRKGRPLCDHKFGGLTVGRGDLEPGRAVRPSAKKRCERGHDQRNSRDQQQDEHDLAKAGFVEMPIEL